MKLTISSENKTFMDSSYRIQGLFFVEGYCPVYVIDSRIIGYRKRDIFGEFIITYTI